MGQGVIKKDGMPTMVQQGIANFSVDGDTWTATDDGFIIILAKNVASGASAPFYAYLMFGTNAKAAIAIPSGGTGGLSYTTACPVKKGNKYTLLIGGFASAYVEFYHW